ncbi:unnamed protein product (macronuclear) [Paramecium tetraurelia]|uniref:Uncharacterized protein n=1 Tax=Paramecium tetraurelia TaxID=5888 RepID=A0BRI2_PARTE|nr:uncharacterized protein GSPATT00031380001 [Paramecium tetraurelia]CAK61149.1 unnamed protein product [Paramecium tetraurelia]|eukprot:XP_001428547.1 hypothetical protein (macronuclear) [Paramecium tetraurelia strain d4-2]
MARGACSSYTIEEQFKLQVVVFVFGKHLAAKISPVLVVLLSLEPHNDFYTYYNTAIAQYTVVATPSNSGDSSTLGGCQQRAAGITYIDKEQCQITKYGDPQQMEWILNMLFWFFATASVMMMIQKARAYIANKCTFSDSEKQMFRYSCYFAKQQHRKQLFLYLWLVDRAIGQELSVFHVKMLQIQQPLQMIAIILLMTVIQIMLNAKLKFLEILPLPQMLYVNELFLNATIYVLDKARCVTSSKGEQFDQVPDMDWIIKNEINYTIKTLSLEPDTLITEDLCKEYFPICPTKQGERCLQKLTCLLNFNKSQDVIQQICRVEEFLEDGIALQNSWEMCKGIKLGVRVACRSNNICYDGSQGACFFTLLVRVQSGPVINEVNKQVINVQQMDKYCVAIVSSSEKNTYGSCAIGVDGISIQQMKALKSIDSKGLQAIYILCQRYLHNS